MPEFHAPYNFIPVTGKINENKNTPTVAYENIKSGKHPYIRHDLWHPDAKHGRIICKVHLETPTMVGGKHTSLGENELTQVEPYRDIDGEIAIPANSLRGMIGSVAETLSQSALRVLDNKRYSVRKPVGGGLSAIGILRLNEQTKKLELQPLTLPVQKKQNNDNCYSLSEDWFNIFNTGRDLINDPEFCKLKYYLPAYISGYGNKIMDGRNYKIFNPGSFLKQNRIISSSTMCYARLELSDERLMLDNNSLQLSIKSNINGQKEKHTENTHFLIGQNIKKRNLQGRSIRVENWCSLTSSGKMQYYDDIIFDADYEKLSGEEKCQYTKGVLRILGIQDREFEIPPTKSHELFIPLHDTSFLSIPADVLNKFYTLSKERADLDKQSSLPFTLQGSSNWRLEDGQIVFFSIRKNQEQIEVDEISVSSIWRKAVEGTTHEFFQSINPNNPNLLPWNPKRSELTPVECLFGVVESDKRDNDKVARALASRLRFSDGRSIKPVETANSLVPLKILASPKPPSPSMYFNPGVQGDYIRKIDLSIQSNHKPNGRKVYLPHRLAAVDMNATMTNNASWKTEYPDKDKRQKMCCQPMLKDQDFYFHIDFDNLSKEELGLLIHSLCPSSKGNFQHRLGLGKSLGLGSVKVTIEGIFLINRVERYKNLLQPRYCEILTPDGKKPNNATEWPERYSQESSSFNNPVTVSPLNSYYNQRNLVNIATLNLLQTVGNLDNLKPGVPVQPPLEESQRLEEETFLWFVNNDNNRANNHHQALLPITANKTLPTLE